MTDQNVERSWSLREVVSKPRRLDLIWFLLPTALALAGFGLIPLRTWDYWWHLTMGRLINFWGAVPAANHFLYTIDADAASYDQAWLAQLLLYGVHYQGGVYLALILRNVAAAVGVAWLSWTAMRRSDSIVIGSLTTLAALPFLFTFIEVRPHLAAWPLFCALLWVGYGVYQGRRSSRWLIAFPVTTIVWANLHGSFPLAAVLAIVFAAGVAIRQYRQTGAINWRSAAPWIASAASTAVAPMANPRTWEIYGYVYHHMTDEVVQNTITEWLPTTLSNPPGIGIYFWAVATVAVFLMVRRSDRLDPVDGMLFILFAGLAVVQARALLWFGFILPITASPSVRRIGESDSERVEPHPMKQRLHSLGAFALVAVAIAVQPTWQWRVDWAAESPKFDVRERAPMKGVIPAETPFEAAEVLARYTNPPRIFHDHRFAGFLLYYLSRQNPQQMVFVDQRVELPPERIWEQYYDVIEKPDVWRGIFNQYDVDVAILSEERQKKLVGRLESSDDWSLLMKSDGWIFYARNRMD